MSAEDMRPRKIIIIELEPLPSDEVDNDEATERTGKRIQQKHELLSGGVEATAVDSGMLSPSGIAPDTERDHESEARIIDKAGPRLQSVLAERAKLVKGHAVESAGSAAAAISELDEMRRELAIEFHVRAEYEMGRAISAVHALWNNYCPSHEEVVRDIIKDGVKWVFIVAVVWIGSQVVG